jgi:hypothetical protein
MFISTAKNTLTQKIRNFETFEIELELDSNVETTIRELCEFLILLQENA